MMRGFTLAEVLIATAIILVLSAALANFVKESMALNRSAVTRLSTEFEGRRAISRITKELRAAASFASTSTDAATFSLDINNDGVSETVRYFIESGALKRDSMGSVTTLVASLGNGTATPLFAWSGRFVTVTVVSGGRTHSSGISLRNP